MKILPKISLAVLPAMFLLSACGTTEEKPADPMAGQGAVATEEATTTPVAPAEDANANQMVEAPVEQIDPLTDPNSLLSIRAVYFEYDSSSVTEDSLSMIKAHADYLSSNSNIRFTLEGHADERGTREYNMALGERRADAVRRLLVANGVDSSQINVISYGEERPAQLGHSESAWSINRRAEFAYPE